MWSGLAMNKKSKSRKCEALSPCNKRCVLVTNLCPLARGWRVLFVAGGDISSDCNGQTNPHATNNDPSLPANLAALSPSSRDQRSFSNSWGALRFQQLFAHFTAPKLQFLELQNVANMFEITVRNENAVQIPNINLKNAKNTRSSVRKSTNGRGARRFG